MGSPKAPTAQLVAQLEKAGQLQLLSASEQIRIDKGVATVNFALPRQGVSLLKLTWE